MVKSIKNVVEFYRIAGDVDYILKLRVKDIAEYDQVYKAIITKVEIADISASFSMEEIIYTTAVPLRPTK
ncbi:leucine-responsive transcriptional regulator [compost metagenome]